MKKYNGLFVAGLVALSGCVHNTVGTTLPHVTDNKILTDAYCKSMNAGYASRLYNVKDVLHNKVIEKVEVCSKWVDKSKNLSSEDTVKTKLVNNNNPYDFNQNTVLAWGQSGANNLILNGNGASNNESYGLSLTQTPPTFYGTGFSGSAQVGTFMPNGALLPLLTGSNNLLPSTNGNYYPFFGNPVNGYHYTSNVISTVSEPAFYNISMPRICNVDSRFNVSGTLPLLLSFESTTISYPVSYLTYCSWNGSSIGLFDSYSTAIQLFGGITAPEIFSNGDLNKCTYSATNPNSANSNTSMTCNISESNVALDVTFSLSQMFSNLQLDANDFQVCFFSTVACAQNGWGLNVSYQSN